MPTSPLAAAVAAAIAAITARLPHDLAPARPGTPDVTDDGRTITATIELTAAPHPPAWQLGPIPAAAQQHYTVTVAITRHPGQPVPPAPVSLEVDLARALALLLPGHSRDGWTVVARQHVETGQWATTWRLVVADEQGRLYAAEYNDEHGDVPQTRPWEDDDVARFDPVAVRVVPTLHYHPPAQPSAW